MLQNLAFIPRCFTPPVPYLPPTRSSVRLAQDSDKIMDGENCNTWKVVSFPTSNPVYNSTCAQAFSNLLGTAIKCQLSLCLTVNALRQASSTLLEGVVLQ